MTSLPVAICQAAPVPLDIDRGFAKSTEWAARAIAEGARLVAFGECWLGGYPLWLDEAPGAALWDHPGTRALHRIMMERAVVEGDPRLAPLQELCDRHGALISIGAHERVRASLLNNQLLLRPALPPLNHRKLVPTHGERLIWSRGDGSTLAVHQAPEGPIGSLICWEHWMPLARAAMHNQLEAVHIAAWPTVRETHAIASRHYAFEGRCFVLAAGLVQQKAELLDGLASCGGNAEAEALLLGMPDGALNTGGSLIIAPDARVLAQAGDGEETIHALLDLGEIAEARAALDTDGHYSRPDVFSLKVDTASRQGVRWAD